MNPLFAKCFSGLYPGQQGKGEQEVSNPFRVFSPGQPWGEGVGAPFRPAQEELVRPSWSFAAVKTSKHQKPAHHQSRLKSKYRKLAKN